MKYKEFEAKVLNQAVGQAILLAQSSCIEDIKIEPEQLRKNVATILTVLIETESFLMSITKESPDPVN